MRWSGTSTPKADPTPVPAKDATPQVAQNVPGTRADGLLYDYWFVAAVDGQIIGYMVDATFRGGVLVRHPMSTGVVISPCVAMTKALLGLSALMMR